MKLMKSLRFRLLFFCFSITTFILVTVLIVNYFTLRSSLFSNLLRTTSYNLQITMDNIDRDMNTLTYLMSWFTINADIIDFLESSNETPNELRTKALRAHQVVRSNLYASGLDEYVNKVIITDFGDRSFQFGLVSGDWSDYQISLNSDFFPRTVISGDPYWVGFINEPFRYSQNEQVIPLSQHIFQQNGLGPLGMVYMTINAKVITNYLSRYSFEEDTRLILQMGDYAYDVQNRNRFVPLSLPGRGLRDFQVAQNSVRTIELDSNGKRQLAAVYPGPNLDWMLAQTISPSQLASQNRDFGRLSSVVIGGILLLTILILITVNQIMNHPIDLINKSLDKIARGDFDPEPAIEWDNEIGYIGKAINRMALDIDLLIHSRISDEKAKKDLEFKMLQNQINPHFLYNTLNTIKWMASIQKAQGIEEMVGALARLLKHVSKGTDEIISLDEELSLLSEYCKVQEYRSAGIARIQYVLEDEELRKCRILKFTLQPLVENAIVHGIEPKMTSGTVTVQVTRPEPDLLRITVGDDGVGIAPDKLKQALNGGHGIGSSFNSIGLHNVDERIKLAFGDQYGLGIESELGVFTRVTVDLPLLLIPDSELRSLDV
jgi:two-component system sensor histidine kinase YesM